MDDKTITTTSHELGHQLVAQGDSVITQDAGTDADKQDMFRMGKVQQMQRIFRLFPMFSFCVILMGTWEIALGASTISLFNGGTAGSIYGFIIDWVGLLAVYSSMAEMGSMAPTSGGQYHCEFSVHSLSVHSLEMDLTHSQGSPSWLLCAFNVSCLTPSAGFQYSVGKSQSHRHLSRPEHSYRVSSY